MNKSPSPTATKRFSVLTLVIALNITSVQAAHPLADIAETARKFLLSQDFNSPYPAEVTVLKLDSRLKLAPCQQPLGAELAFGTPRNGRQSVKVHCAGPKPWALLVPAKVLVYQDVVVATRTIARGTLLTKTDLQLEKRPSSELRGAVFERVDPLIRMRTRSQIQAGKPLRAQQIKPQVLIARGEIVTLSTVTSQLSVRTRVEALEDGGLGDRVKLRNRVSGRVVEATVKGRGIASLHP